MLVDDRERARERERECMGVVGAFLLARGWFEVKQNSDSDHSSPANVSSVGGC